MLALLACEGNEIVWSILQILEGLYVGSLQDSDDDEQLTAAGVTHVLSVINLAMLKQPKPHIQ